MRHGNAISIAAGLVLTAGILSFGACTDAGETTDQAEDSGMTELPEGHPAIGGENGTDVAGEPADETAAANGTEGRRSPHGRVSMVSYECAGGGTFSLTLAEGLPRAAFRMGEELYQLEQREVASGMEYSDGSVTVRGDDSAAVVERDGEPILTDCQASGQEQ